MAMSCLATYRRSTARPVRALARRDHPAHNIAAEDIKDDVQVKAGLFHRPLDLLHGSEFFDRGLQGHCGFWANCL